MVTVFKQDTNRVLSDSDILLGDVVLLDVFLFILFLFTFSVAYF